MLRHEMPYPWQRTQWQYLCDRKAQGTLPHALLLAGPEGLGKQDFSEAFAQYLLCEQPVADAACQICHGCSLFAAKTHPDFCLLEPEEGGAVIKIDQAREAIDWLGKTAQQGRYKVVMVSPAEAMNLATVNAVLKSLEEPPSQTVWLLVSHHDKQLPATLRSRCQRLIFRPAIIAEEKKVFIDWFSQHFPAVEKAGEFLAWFDYCPLRAAQWASAENKGQREQWLSSLQELWVGKADPIPLASRFAKQDISVLLGWLMRWVCEMIRIKTGSAKEECLSTKNFSEKKSSEGAVFKQTEEAALLTHACADRSLSQLFAYLDKLYETRRYLNGKVNLNTQLVLEDLLCSW